MVNKRHIGHRREVRAFTLIELLIAIAIVGLLAGLLTGALDSARGKAREASCFANLRQIGQAASMYAQDNDDLFPYGGDPADLHAPSIWTNTDFADEVKQLQPLPIVLNPYVRNGRLWMCPSDTGFRYGDPGETVPLDSRPSSFDRFGSSYYATTMLVMERTHFSRAEAISARPPYETRNASQIVYLYDGSGRWHGGAVSGAFRRSSLFVDGHVRSLDAGAFDTAMVVTIPATP